MSLNTISTEFEAAFNQKKRIRPTARPDRPLHQYAHTIYPLQCLAALSEQVKIKASKNRAYNTLDDEFLPNYAARFVVALNGQILFSLEGPRSKSVPAHSDIESTVLTAGNIIFSSDYSKIAQITNKSGHFQPSFGTLVFAIPLILRSGFPLAEDFCLVDEKTHCTYLLRLDELSSLNPKDYPQELFLAKNREIVAPFTSFSSPSTSPQRKRCNSFRAIFLDFSDSSSPDVVESNSFHSSELLSLASMPTIIPSPDVVECNSFHSSELLSPVTMFRPKRNRGTLSPSQAQSGYSTP
ncbi:MAG: hypothetical protein EBY16_07075 [Gammaproteobacteria bacterium]|nr:hypothetical protein [Gammaproteobacteria bacterium]